MYQLYCCRKIFSYSAFIVVLTSAIAYDKRQLLEWGSMAGHPRCQRAAQYARHARVHNWRWQSRRWKLCACLVRCDKLMLYLTVTCALRHAAIDGMTAAATVGFNGDFDV